MQMFYFLFLLYIYIYIYIHIYIFKDKSGHEYGIEHTRRVRQTQIYSPVGNKEYTYDTNTNRLQGIHKYTRTYIRAHVYAHTYTYQKT